MEKKLGKFVESVTDFFTGGDAIPWSKPDLIGFCEQEVATAEKGGDSDDLKRESLLRLSWALVHSKRPEDVQRGIAMLEAALASKSIPHVQMKDRIYLLAVGYYRSGEFSRSRLLVEECLEISPDWSQARTLKKTIEDKVTRDGVIGIGIAATAVGLLAAATAVGLLAGGITAALSRKK